MFLSRRPRGRHRLGAPGLVWCRALPQVAAALSVPHIARRGLVERFLAGPRHLRPALVTPPPAFG
ncbi:hypothetical protein Acsp06_04440 [Actinomycetospora sp. NBRC 106375]|uniref:hypothetical protein n=1 Tax=Actinomycetospora sp. NBRC 106375 TaxID=3032207 RepID=UPI00249FA57B|nr:hypothetical protein [Actinomycetospora sp. NBRC 106375]GLZ44259.1 hypothetical protein Acsp06_04440 [Actinomycetospora sp. NBRC 106375]